MDSTGKITESPRRPVQAASAALISVVLGNDDLLREILLRLDFPTCLVRAAAVSKRLLKHASDPAFLRSFCGLLPHRLDFPTCLVRAAAVSKRLLKHASDPAFLRSFCGLHPPRLLGFYLNNSDYFVRFIPLPQPPELAAVTRHGKFDLGKGALRVSDCRNGCLVVYMMKPDDRWPDQRTVCRPLHPERGALSLPLLHPALAQDSLVQTHCNAPTFLFHDDGGDDVAISAVYVVHNLDNKWQTMVRLQDFRSGVWSECRNSEVIELPGRLNMYYHSALLAIDKIYIRCTIWHILGLDVQSMSLFPIKLPDGVEYEYDANVPLSRAEGSEFCLIHVRGFQLCVWRYTMDHSSIGNWDLVDTISLLQVFGPNADPAWSSQGAVVRVQVAAVGDNADFVFLRIQQKVFCLHILSRIVEKVYELAQYESLSSVSPFMIVWPPTFPILNGGHDKDE